MANYETKKMLKMMCSDGNEVVVEEAVAMKSQTIRHMIEDNCAEGIIPIPNVTATVLSKVFQYCKKHLDCPLTNVKDLKDFDDKFVKVDVNTLYDLMMVVDHVTISFEFHPFFPYHNCSFLYFFNAILGCQFLGRERLARLDLQECSRFDQR